MVEIRVAQENHSLVASHWQTLSPNVVSSTSRHDWDKNNLVMICTDWIGSCKSNYYANHIGGVMVNMLASSAVDSGFEWLSGQTNDYEIGFCWF